MGVSQNSLRSMSPVSASSTIRSRFFIAVVVLFVVWSLLSLDTHTNSLKTEVIYKDGSVGRLGANDALRIMGGSQPAAAGVDATVPKQIEAARLPLISDSSNEVKKKPVAPVQEVSDRPLILYAYSQSDFADINLPFFVAHGLHDAADFIFILNGENNATEHIPNRDNIRIIQRSNDCYDLGAYSEVLQTNDLYKSYKRFIMLNASIRGPFMPYWSDACWSDMYLGKLTNEVKLVGMTSNCWPTFHVQSMIWATDLIGLETLLHPPERALEYISKHPIKLPPGAAISSYTPPSSATKSPIGLNNPTTPSPETPRIHQAPGINGCFHNWESAVAAEVSSTSVIRAAGYKVDVMMSAFHGNKKYEEGESCENDGNVLFKGKYWGVDVYPFETGFLKSHGDIDNTVLERYTQWMDGRAYSSYDVCHSSPGSLII